MSGPSGLGASDLLANGTLCYVAARTSLGPHVTPLVFAYVGDRVWITTSRGSVKARAWGVDNAVGGMIRHQGRALCFRGLTRTYDVLDPSSWGGAVRSAPALALATAGFTRKNARFFAGYAVDARRIPLGWTPPGRVLVEIQIEAWALIDVETGEIAGSTGGWPRSLLSANAFKASRAAGRPGIFHGVPQEVAGRVGSSGEGALAISGSQGPVVLPVRWAADRGHVDAGCASGVLELAAAHGDAFPAALAVDKASSWRASEMAGVLFQGDACAFRLSALGSGARSAAARLSAAGAVARDAALVRLTPSRVVWWRGWSSGTTEL